MAGRPDFIIGTSGYSFKDWVGPFYPPGTTPKEMFSRYVESFRALELNFSYYRMPTAKMLASFAERSPEGFLFWVKANREITHEGKAESVEPFAEALPRLAEAGKLAGVLLQFPQSFHRTVDARRHLAEVIERFGATPLAVEFRHASWRARSVNEGLRERGVTLAVPDVPEIPSLYRSPPAATTRTGYLRLHSRDADKWYARDADRYDYLYSPEELRRIAAGWLNLPEPADRVFTFFNNCHGGQAAENAEAFERIVAEF